MSELFLHIGTEKTGTTTLQYFLRDNRDNLEPLGVSYLRSQGYNNAKNIVLGCIDNKKAQSFARNAGIPIDSNIEDWRSNLVKSIQSEIDELSKKGIKRFVISSELFHSRVTTKDEINRLWNVLNPLFDTIYIIVYLRRQDLVATSLYSTYLRKGGIRKNVLPKQGEYNTHFYDYNNLLELWADVFGKEYVKPKIFERDYLKNGDIIDDFLSVLEIQEKKNYFNEVPKRNESLSAKTQLFLRYFNENINFSPNMPQGLKKIRKRFIEIIQDKYPGSGLKPTKEQALNFYQFFISSNEKLSRNWLDGASFKQDFDNYESDSQSIVLEPDDFNLFYKVMNQFFKEYSVIKNEDIKKTVLKENKAEIFKELALRFKEIDLNAAIFFMTEAKKIHPANHFFKSKIESWEKKLNKTEV